MQKKIYYFVIMFSVIFLSGCKEEINYSYYMQHPIVLKKVVTECQSSILKTKEQAEQCEIAMSAATNLMSLIEQQQMHPEEFGQRVLDQEYNLTKSKEMMMESQRALNVLKAQSASSTEIKKSEDDLDEAKKNYQEQELQLKIALAVLGLSSPD